MIDRSKVLSALAALLALLVVEGTPHAAAQEAQPSTWSEAKCARYKKAWAEVLARRGKGLGREFIDRHEAFLASGCTADADVCPRSPREIEIANILTIAAMKAGTASTFPPFACKR